jgi:hypothetical protein
MLFEERSTVGTIGDGSVPRGESGRGLDKSDRRRLADEGTMSDRLVICDGFDRVHAVLNECCLEADQQELTEETEVNPHAALPAAASLSPRLPRFPLVGRVCSASLAPLKDNWATSPIRRDPLA